MRTAYHNSEHDLGGPTIDDAAIEVFIHRIAAPVLTGVVLKVAEGLADAFPQTPDGQSVPLQGRWLFVRARRAYRGDYEARRKFLQAIGVEPAADEALALREVLKPTFAPVRPDKRRDWWTEAPERGTAFLRSRLKDAQARDQGRMKYVPLDNDLAEILPEERGGDPRAWELELRMWSIRQAIFSRLPQRQGEVVFLCWEYFDEDHPAATSRAVAERLGISARAVREHCRKAASNPESRRALGF
jgi:hypothetical protein